MNASDKNAIENKENIVVPSMGESVSEAVIGRFIANSGDRVEAGTEIVELETDKLNQTLSAPFSGTVHWQVKEGDRVEVGQILGNVEKQEKEEVSLASLPGIATLVTKPTKENKALMTETKTEVSKKSPRILKEETLEWDKKEKIEIAVAEPSCEKATLSKSPYREKRERLPQMRKAIAQNLLKAQSEAAMLTTFNEIDMSAVIKLREKHGEAFLKKHGVKLGFMSFFVKAAVSALKRVPALNARIEGDEWVERLDYHLGVAVSTEKGLVVPVLRDCDQMSLASVESQLVDMASRAREGKISLKDLQGGSFTITNGGVFGSLLSTPILNSPQSGILGMHKIQKRAIVNEKDEIVVAPMMYVALTYDHRVVDGRQAVGFLIAVKELIEAPEKLLLDM